MPACRAWRCWTWITTTATARKVFFYERPDVFFASIHGDPISGFGVHSTDYLRLGERLARVGLPTVLVLEGGYAVDGLGVNAANVLQAFA